MGKSIFDELNNAQYGSQQQVPPRGKFNRMNPFQMMGEIANAMRNPAAFVNSHIPGIPKEIANDPNKILQYFQGQGLRDEQIREAHDIANQIQGIGSVK